jgi:quinol-cytochrome oxidoreductase complex cytochrome b subunit
MAESFPNSDNISPKDPNKSYALVEIVPGESLMVGKVPDDTVFTFPIVLLWEMLLLLGVTLGIFLFSIIKQAPLEEIANPLVTTDPAKAPWYFLGLQELLEHMHPLAAGVIIPGMLVIFLIALLGQSV